MTPNEARAKKYVADIKKALKRFGEYNYYDKGASEVMDMRQIGNELGQLTVADVAETLKLVKDGFTEHYEPFVRACVSNLDSWPGFDELLEKNDWLAELY